MGHDAICVMAYLWHFKMGASSARAVSLLGVMDVPVRTGEALEPYKKGATPCGSAMPPTNT
jgi:hypothetical protein